MLGLIRGRGQELVRGRGQERGAVAVIVGLVVAMFVLTGVAALAIDGGTIYTQRRVAQNGADAASLALAQICAKNLADPLCADKTNPTDTAALKTYLTTLAVDNAGSGYSPTISEICGGGAGTKFGACAGGTLLTDCPAWPASIPTNNNWVAVKTRIFVPRIFAGLADATYGGKTVQACARAAWGPGYPPEGVVAVTDHSCAWEAATSNGYPPEPGDTGYIPAPNQTPLAKVPVADKYVVKVLLQGAPKSSTDPATCGKNDTSSGQYTAGNFGWLDVKAGTDCTADMSTDTGVVGGNTGAAAKGNCGEYLAKKVGSIIYLPIFKSVAGTGNGAKFQLDGVAAFFLAGFQAPSAKTVNAYDAGGNTSPTPHCIEKTQAGVSKDDGCLWGWFLKPYTQGVFSVGTPRGPTNVGVAG